MMSEVDAQAAYEAVLAHLEREVPSLHAQVLDEVQRGRELKASDISRTEKTSRNKELVSQKLGRLSDSDLAAVELTPEERLMVLVRAISVATETYNASAATLARFGAAYDVNRIEFESPSDDRSESAARADAEDSGDVDGTTQADGSTFVIADGDIAVSREAIDIVLEDLELGDEHG